MKSQRTLHAEHMHHLRFDRIQIRAVNETFKVNPKFWNIVYQAHGR